MNAALEFELLKARRAGVFRWGAVVAAVGVPALSTGFFELVRLGGDSPSAAKAATMITDLSLAGLLGTAGQVLSVAILMTAGIAASWSFGREFVDDALPGVVCHRDTPLFGGRRKVRRTGRLGAPHRRFDGHPHRGRRAARWTRHGRGRRPDGVPGRRRRSAGRGVGRTDGAGLELAPRLPARNRRANGCGRRDPARHRYRRRAWFPYAAPALWMGMGGAAAASQVSIIQLLLPLLVAAIGCRRDAQLVAARRGALNAYRFGICDHGASNGTAYSAHTLLCPLLVGNAAIRRSAGCRQRPRGTPLREGGGSSPHYDGYEQLEPGQLSWTADRLQDRHGGVTVPVINCPVPISPPDRHDRL